jgi:hypothetical protein
VIHFTHGVIKEDTLKDYAYDCVVRKAANVYMTGDILPRQVTKRYHPDDVIKRAYSKLGGTGYSLVKNNCEHFASWCKTGTACSIQVKALGLKSFLHYVPGFNTMIMYD